MRLSVENGFVFRINRWGIILKSQFLPIQTHLKNEHYYYSGNAESTNFGVSYDMIKKEKFSLSPYFLLGASKTEMYLDYELKPEVKPTALKLESEQSNLVVGLKSYFRVKTWFENRLELYVTADAFYRYMSFVKLRSNHMLISHKEMYFEQFGVLAGASLRYNF